MPRVLKDSFKGEVRVWKQTGPHEVVRAGVPAYIGVSLDVDKLIEKLGEKAMKSKGKRATAFHGALVLEVKKVEKNESEDQGHLWTGADAR